MIGRFMDNDTKGFSLIATAWNRLSTMNVDEPFKASCPNHSQFWLPTKRGEARNVAYDAPPYIGVRWVLPSIG